MPFDARGFEIQVETIEKIEQVMALLADEQRWCKRALRRPDGRMCILGAVRAADAELALYAPILRAIRAVTGHDYRQIEKFNDDWLTTHALVLDVLMRVRDDLANAAGSDRPAPPPLRHAPRLRRWLARLLFSRPPATAVDINR